MRQWMHCIFLKLTVLNTVLCSKVNREFQNLRLSDCAYKLQQERRLTGMEIRMPTVERRFIHKGMSLNDHENNE